MDPARKKRKDDIDNALAFIQSSLPFPDPKEYQAFLTQLVNNLLEEGSVSFKDGDCDKAIKDYAEGVNVVHYAQAEDLDLPESLLECLYVSRATVYHSMAEYELGVQDCENALAVCKGSHEALYRKALCLKEMGLYREAYHCTTEAPLDQQMNDLAKELAGLLGLRNRKPYNGSQSKDLVNSGDARQSPGLRITESIHSHTAQETPQRVDSENVRNDMGKTPSVVFSGLPSLSSLPASVESFTLPPYASYGPTMHLPNSQASGPSGLSFSVPDSDPQDSELIGDDLDSLLDCFPNEPEATLTHIQSAFPIESTTARMFKPIQFPTTLPAPSPQLPPAFFIPAASQVNALKNVPDLGGGFAATFSSNKTESLPLDSLDPLGSLDSLDDLDLFPDGGEGDDAYDGMTLDKELDSLAPFGYLHVTGTMDPRATRGKTDKTTFKTSNSNNLIGGPLRCGKSMGLLTGSVASGAAATFSSAGLNDLDSLDDLGALPLLKGATASVPIVQIGGEGLDSLSDFTPPGQKSFTIAPSAGRVAMPSSHMDKNGVLPGSVPSQLYKHPLFFTHEFMQACSSCYFREGAGIYSYVHMPDLVHHCQRDIVLCRKKAAFRTKWTRIRLRPSWLEFTGPYVLCQEILNSGDLGWCKYGENCTFAFNQYEVDVWTHERNGTLHRDLLFETPDARDQPVVTVQKLLQQFNGMFIFLCQVCYDSKPRMISKRSTDKNTICSNLAACHPFDANKCLVHAVRTNSVNYRKIRPMNHGCQFDVCRHAVRYGCERGDLCHFAHSLIELKTWQLQKNTGMEPDKIVTESAKYLQKQEQHNSKQKICKSSPWAGTTAAAGTAGSTGSTGSAAGGTKSKGGPTVEGAKGLNMKMKFVCAQCWKDGLMSEPDKSLKYCSAKGRHSWTKERRVLLVRCTHKAAERNKWVQVRPLPSAKTFPIQYELCKQMLKLRKCNYVGICAFAHSEEEKELWTYMKNNSVLDMQQVYEMWLSLTNHSHQEGTLLAQPVQQADEKCIAMPTDNAEPMNGFHCRLCGRHSNSERQWQQHISSERHKDRVFGCEGEEESLTWTYRFPGREFHLCPRLVRECPEGASCDYAHSPEELVEWKERRDFLRRKLAKAREDMLIMPRESDFGKYNFLLQD